MATSQFTIYSSFDDSAPQLNGDTGSLVTVLTACLVTGYGSQPAAGWSADYTFTEGSGSTFRPPSGSRMYLNVDDRGIINGPREAIIRGYETMTSFDSGSGMFPRSGSGGVNEKTGYLTVKKSNTPDISSSRPWTIAADAYGMYMWIVDGYAPPVYNQGFTFGDIYSFKPTTDNYNCLIIGRTLQNSNATSAFDRVGIAGITQPGHWIARSWTGFGGSVGVGKFTDRARICGNYLSGSNSFPNGPDNALYLAPIYISEVTGSVTSCAIRGKLRGIHAVCHQSTYFSDGDIINGTGTYAGKTFRMIKPLGESQLGIAAIETSNTVDTN